MSKKTPTPMFIRNTNTTLDKFEINEEIELAFKEADQRILDILWDLTATTEVPVEAMLIACARQTEGLRLFLLDQGVPKGYIDGIIDCGKQRASNLWTKFVSPEMA